MAISLFITKTPFFPCSKLYYRIRCGVYRIVYMIQDDILVVLVLELGRRKDIYRS